MKANKQIDHHLDQLLSQTVLKGEGQHNRAAGYKAKQKHTKKKKYSQPSVKELSSCLGYAFEEVVGFPLASSRADVLALWPTEEPCGAARRESWYFFFFFFKGLYPPFRVRITPFTATPVQKRREEEILGNRRGKRREQQSSFVCCTDCGG